MKYLAEFVLMIVFTLIILAYISKYTANVESWNKAVNNLTRVLEDQK